MPKIFSELQLIFIPCQENRYRPKFLETKVLFWYIIALLVLKLVMVLFFVSFPGTIFFADLTKSTLIELTNQERESLGIPFLKDNPKLDEAAYLKGKDMLEKDYFSHQSPAGVSPWYWFKKSGYSYQYAGENLAIGFLDSEEVYQAWKDSPSHRANLFNPNYQDIGIAVLKGDYQGDETTLVVQLFGSEIGTGTKIKETVKSEKEAQEDFPSQTPEEKKVSPQEIPEGTGVTVGKGGVKIAGAQIKENDLKVKFLSFMALTYPDILGKIIFYSLILIIISLVLNILVKIDIQHRDLILKTLIFIAILVLFFWSDKEIIIKLIPHALSIY
jgi:hypothetical protein